MMTKSTNRAELIASAIRMRLSMNGRVIFVSNACARNTGYKASITTSLKWWSKPKQKYSR